MGRLQVHAGDDGAHTGQRLGSAQVIALDQCVRMRRAQHDGMGQAVELQVVEIGTLAGDEAHILAPTW